MTLVSPAFAAYLAPARPRPALWRLLAGLALISVVYVAGNAGALGLLAVLRGREAAGTLTAKLAIASTPATVLILLATFAPLALGTALAARLLHRRSLASLIGPRRRVIRDFGRAALTVLAVYAPMIGLWVLLFDSLPNLPAGLWLALLPLTCLGIAVQTLAEELVFRGYMVQQLAVRFAAPVIWVGLPALAFAGLHFDPGRMGGAAPLAVAFALGFALIATDLTRRTGSLGAAWGMHFANNLIAIAGMATGPSLSGLALRATPYGPEAMAASPLLVAADLLPLLVAWGLLRRWLAR
jgi:membrane protease YdiL (CAAX protease family)